MKISYKILLLLLVPFVFLTAFQLDTMNSFISQSEQIRKGTLEPLTEEVEHTTALSFDMQRKNEIAHKIEMFEANNSKEGLDALVSEYREVKDDSDYNMKQLENFSMHSILNRTKDFMKIKNAVEKINLEDAQLLDTLEQGQNITDLLNKVHADHEQLSDELNDYRRKSFDGLVAAGQQVQDIEKEGFKTLFLSSELMFIAFVGLALIIHAIVVKPIERIKDSIELISEGRLETEIAEKDRNDEIGDLARAFERTIVSLKLAMKKTPPKIRIKPFQEEI